ncbi:MAG: EAL domain-containing protein [Thiotrichales bacterium]|nr:EAL domain-containing protein [Thiotrichales bacterium]
MLTIYRPFSLLLQLLIDASTRKIGLMLIVCLLFSPWSVAQQHLRLGIYAHLDEATMHQKFGPLVAFLNRELPDTTVTYEVLPADALRKAIQQNRFDLLLTNPSLYEIIRNENTLGGAIATLQLLKDQQVTTSLGGVIFIRSNHQRIKTLKDLERKRIAMPDFSNTGAYRVPLYELSRQKVNVSSIDFKPVGNNEAVVRAVMNGEVDAGFVRTGILEDGFETGVLKPEDIRVLNARQLNSFPYLLSTQLYPEWPIYALSHLSDDQIKAITIALFSLKADDPAAKAAGIAGFVPALDYLPLERLLRELHLEPYDVEPAFHFWAFWEAYQAIIWLTIVGVFLVLILLVISLRLSFRLKQIAQQAKQESTRIQSIIESGKLGTWEWSMDTGFLRFNHYWAGMIGYDLNELPNHANTFFERLHPEDISQVQAKIEDVTKGILSLYDVEFRLRHKAGHWVWILARGQIIKWGDRHQPLLMTGIQNDITDSKQQQQALKVKAQRDAALLALPQLSETYSEKVFLQCVLEIIEDLTQSQVSFMHGYDDKTQTIELLSWSRRTLETYCHMGNLEPHYPLKDAGIWAEGVRHQQPVLVNDYANAADKHGLPQGHAQLTRFISVPIMEQGRVVMLVGVGNKQTDYDDEEVSSVLLLGNEVYRLLQKKHNEQKLQQAASVFKYSQEGIIITDAQVKIVDVNAAYLTMCGYAKEEVIGQNPKMFNSGHQDGAFYEQMWQQILQKGFWRGEIWNRHKNGQIYPQFVNISVITNEEGVVTQYIGLFSDISVQKEQQQALERMAHFDPLTHLPNRSLLSDRLDQAMARARRNGKLLAVGFMDLDGFKEINDTYGHEAGDELLITLSKRFSDLLRSEDTLSRLGGDEFVMVIVDLNRADQIKPLLNRLLVEAQKPIIFENLLLKVSVSIGVSFYALNNPEVVTPNIENLDADQLIRQADQAMYQAKNLGKNQAVIYQANLAGITQDDLFSKEVSAGLDADEFCLYYQPKVNLRQAKVEGFEALIRWQHPQKGFLMPGEFLDLIMNPDIKIKMSLWVIKTALKQMAAWKTEAQAAQERGMFVEKLAALETLNHAQDEIDFCVSVNIDATTLESPTFLTSLETALAAYPMLNPSSLTLEVLESSALQDITRASKVIMDMRELGVSFAIDDFGVGYASLNYLRDLPVHQVKIDQSFVLSLLDNPQSLTILEAIWAMSEAFGHDVVAEGVETEAHCKVLMQLGYELVQGYVISRPMPADQVLKWILNWQPEQQWQTTQVLTRLGKSLLMAMIEHQLWIANLAACLDEPTKSVPQLDETQCRFGVWLKKQSPDLLKQADVGECLDHITQLHLEAHTRAKQFMQLLTLKDVEQAKQQMTHLFSIKDQLLAALENLAQQV